MLEARQQPIESNIVSILLDDEAAQPLGNEPVYHNGEIIGKTTSASFAYRVGRPVAIALIKRQSERLLDGLIVEIDIAREFHHGIIINEPAFDPDGLRMRSKPGIKE